MIIVNNSYISIFVQGDPLRLFSIGFYFRPAKFRHIVKLITERQQNNDRCKLFILHLLTPLNDIDDEDAFDVVPLTPPPAGGFTDPW